MNYLKPLPHITWDLVKQHQFGLVRFSEMTEADLQNIWRREHEPQLDNFDKLVHRYDMPLYQKMIIRFRNENRIATNLFKGCDPGNQQMVLRFYFGPLCHDLGNLIEFFAWISNSLGAYGIHEMDPEKQQTNIDDSRLVNLWRKNSNIKFYFLLSLDLQIAFINKYNHECVDRYNSMRINP